MKKIAFVFPGQGSQTVGMLKELAALYPIIQQTFTEASSTLGYNLWKLIQEGPLEQLNQTEYAQPALLAAGVAVWRVWQNNQYPMPSLFAGHSLGEYTALVCADALDFKAAIKLVEERGKVMQNAVPVGKGAMAAIVGLTEEKVLNICQQAAQNAILAPANYNSIGQIVIAGETSAVERAIELAKQAKAKIAKFLPVSVPSHCVLMEPAAMAFKEKLDKINIKKPGIPVLHNVDVESHDTPNEIRNVLVKQLYNTVKWTQTIQKMAQQYGISYIFECGPGKVLTGLSKRIVSDIVVETLGMPENFESAVKLITLNIKED